MSRNTTQPPWEFLLSASKNSLQSFELTRLSHAANLRKEIGTLLDQWMEENTSAMLARWLMEQRDQSQRRVDALQGGEGGPNGSAGASDNFLAEPAASPPPTRRGA